MWSDHRADDIKSIGRIVNPVSNGFISSIFQGFGTRCGRTDFSAQHFHSGDVWGLPLDIDVLLYGEQVGDFDGLILPRAEILKNAFVLWPLALHAPQVLHPGVQRSFADLWQTAQIAQQLQPIAFQWRGHELTPSELILAHSGA